MFNLWVLFAGLLTVANCAIVRSVQQQSNLPFLKVASVNSDFAFKLYHQIASEETGKNIFLSPFSISTAFAFLSLGAKSSTLSQLLSGLGFNLKETSEEEIHKAFQHLIQALNRPKGEIEVSLGNALFIQDQFKILQKFLTDAKNIHHADVVSTNFKKPQEATRQINSYIEKQTHGKLVDAVKDIDSSVLAVLVNYMFFRARWERPFYSKVTKKMDFFLDGKTKVQVPTMINENYYQYYYDKKLFYQVVRLPYKGKVSAYFVLPDPEKLKQVEAALGKNVLSNWGKSLSEKKLLLFLPRFSLATSYDVKKILNKLGVVDVFTDHADLSGITGARNLRVSKAIHKAFIHVRESGTETGAVTELELVDRFTATNIHFNRPFLVVIIDDATMSILFMGRVNNPSVEQSQN